MPAPIVRTGKIVTVTSDPPGFVLRLPGPPVEDKPYTHVGDRQLAVASLAYAKGSDADVSDQDGACVGVTAK